MTKLNLKYLRAEAECGPPDRCGACGRVEDMADWIERAQRLLERWEEVDGDRDCYCEAQFPETCQPCLRKQLLAELEES